MVSQDLRRAAKQARRLASAAGAFIVRRRDTILIALVYAVVNAGLVACVIYALWCQAVSDEMEGRTSAMFCETSFRGTTCTCSFSTRQRIFIPVGELPLEVCKE